MSLVVTVTNAILIRSEASFDYGPIQPTCFVVLMGLFLRLSGPIQISCFFREAQLLMYTMWFIMVVYRLLTLEGFF